MDHRAWNREIHTITRNKRMNTGLSPLNSSRELYTEGETTSQPVTAPPGRGTAIQEGRRESVPLFDVNFLDRRRLRVQRGKCGLELPMPVD